MYPVEDVIGSRGGWDFGFNVGGGVGFGIGESSEFYVEMRYHYVAGPGVHGHRRTRCQQRQTRAGARRQLLPRSRSDSVFEGVMAVTILVGTPIVDAADSRALVHLSTEPWCRGL